MLSRLAAYFEFARHGTNFRREVLGGATTFATMAYIVVVNPAILSAAGMTAGFVPYPLLKLAAGRGGEVGWGLWSLFGLSLLFYIFYPYH